MAQSIANRVVNAFIAMLNDPANKDRSILNMASNYISKNPELKGKEQQLVSMATKANKGQPSKIGTGKKPKKLKQHWKRSLKINRFL